MISNERDDFLITRKTCIGGSDSGAWIDKFLGVQLQYSSPLTVWASKVGRLKRQYSSAMRNGHDREDLIRKEFAKRYPKDQIIDGGDHLRHEKCPFIGANLDGQILRDGKDSEVLEIKTCRLLWENLPAYYYSQVQHYMLVTGLKSAVVFAEDSKGNYREYPVKAHKRVHTMMIDLYSEFWKNHVELDIPPKSSGVFNEINVFYGSKIEDPYREGLLRSYEKTQDIYQLDLIKSLIKEDSIYGTMAIKFKDGLIYDICDLSTEYLR